MTDEFDPETDDFDPYSYSEEVGWGLHTKVFLGLLVAGVVGGSAWLFLDIPGWWAGDTDLLGNYRYKQEIERRRAQMTPLERVHAEHFPDWLVAASRSALRAKSHDAREQYGKIREALEDETLKSVLDEFKSTIESGDLYRKHDRIDDLMNRWNSRLEEMGEPYMVRLKVYDRGARSFVFGGFYQKLATPVVEVAADEYPSMLLKRIDTTNMWESYLGASRDDGRYTFVITDRIFDFVIQDVLPVLGVDEESEDDEFGAVERAFANLVVKDLYFGLGRETYKTVVEVAGKRRAMAKAVEKIRSRRECGSNFRITNPPWNGYNAKTLDRLEKFADRDRLKPCPTVEYDEVDTLTEGSRFLRRDEVQTALESLVALASRSTTTHEVRHRADSAAWRERRSKAVQAKIEETVHDAFESVSEQTGDADNATGRRADQSRQPVPEPERPGRTDSGRPIHYNGPPCSGCSRKLSRSTRSELSGYLASIAWSGLPNLALFQACTARLTGAHRRALALILDRVGAHCDETPPMDLEERARSLERELFDRSEPIELPDDFPERVDIGNW